VVNKSCHDYAYIKKVENPQCNQEPCKGKSVTHGFSGEMRGIITSIESSGYYVKKFVRQVTIHMTL
jgi:hypothetical protein